MSSDQGFCKVCNQAIYFDYGVNEWMHTRFVSGSNEYDHGAELATDTNPTPGPPLSDPIITAVLDAANATLRREFGRMVNEHIELFSEAPTGWQMPALSRGEVRAVLGAFFELEEAGEMDRLVGEGEVGNG